jgi:hypothetical protein
MNWRYRVYCVLLSIATLLAMRDAQIGGGFTPAFVIFLVFTVVLMIAVIEGACWACVGEAGWIGKRHFPFEVSLP